MGSFICTTQFLGKQLILLVLHRKLLCWSCRSHNAPILPIRRYCQHSLPNGIHRQVQIKYLTPTIFTLYCIIFSFSPRFRSFFCITAFMYNGYEITLNKFYSSVNGSFANLIITNCQAAYFSSCISILKGPLGEFTSLARQKPNLMRLEATSQSTGT